MGKFISTILVLLLIIISIPTAYAAYIVPSSGKAGENITFSFNADNGVLSFEGAGEMYDFGTDASNRAPWGEDCGNTIKEVIFSDGITHIGKRSFSACYGIKSFMFSPSIVSIGDFAFSNCKGLTDIELPKDLSFLGMGAFNNTDNLLNILIDTNNPFFTTEDGVLYNKNQTVIIKYPPMKTDVKLVVKNGVKSIGYYAMQNCKYLCEVDLPYGFETIDSYAFYWAQKLTVLKVPSTLTYVGNMAFFCSRLVSSVQLSYNNSKAYIDSDCTEPARINSMGIISTSILYWKLKGDTDNNGIVNLSDNVNFTRTLANWKGYCLPKNSLAESGYELLNCDIDGDSRITIIDNLYLARAIAGWDGYTKYLL